MKMEFLDINNLSKKALICSSFLHNRLSQKITLMGNMVNCPAGWLDLREKYIPFECI
jgi:hypothetical protein